MGTSKQAPRKPAEVLLVENNSSDIRLMQEAFRESAGSSKLNVARDGEQALAFLRGHKPYENSPRPAYILLDLNLPNKGGWEVLGEIKQDESLRSIPVVVFPTSTGAQDVAHAYALHANVYIPKPTGLDKLVKVREEIERFWLETAALPAEVSSSLPTRACQRTS